MEHASPAAILLIVLFVGPVLYAIRRAMQGKEIFIRRIPGIDALDEAVGRAVELGRPISFTTGLVNVGPTLYACLGVLRHIATKTATFGTRLFFPCNDPEVLAVTDATLQNAYRSVGKLSRYDSNSLVFLSSEQFAFAAGYMGLLHREKVASAFLFGTFAAESLILAEAGQQIGAIQVAATTSNEQIPFFITACDYTLMGEELFAAGAFLSPDPVLRGSMRGQDLAKLIILGMVLLGVVQTTLLSISPPAPAAEGAQAQASTPFISRLLHLSWADVTPATNQPPTGPE